MSDEIKGYTRAQLGTRPLTGSDVEAILIRAKEKAVLAGRDADVQLADVQDAVHPSSIHWIQIYSHCRN